jgi:hypothetical protein
MVVWWEQCSLPREGVDGLAESADRILEASSECGLSRTGNEWMEIRVQVCRNLAASAESGIIPIHSYCWSLMKTLTLVKKICSESIFGGLLRIAVLG